MTWESCHRLYILVCRNLLLLLSSLLAAGTCLNRLTAPGLMLTRARLVARRDRSRRAGTGGAMKASVQADGMSGPQTCIGFCPQNNKTCKSCLLHHKRTRHWHRMCIDKAGRRTFYPGRLFNDMCWPLRAWASSSSKTRCALFEARALFFWGR